MGDSRGVWLEMRAVVLVAIGFVLGYRAYTLLGEIDAALAWMDGGFAA